MKIGCGRGWGTLLAVAAAAWRPAWPQSGKAVTAAAILEIRTSATEWQLPPLLLQAQSDLVEDDVVVRDQNGDPISGLTRDRFQIRDNGRPRPLSFFSMVKGAEEGEAGGGAAPTPVGRNPVAAPPRSIALLFDDVATSAADLMLARQAATAFVRGELGGSDEVAIFTSSGTVSLGFTRDRAALAAAIGTIGLHPRMGLSLSDCPRITPYEAYLISRYNDRMALDAVGAEKQECDLRQGLQGGGGAMDSIRMLAEATWSQARGMAYDLLETVDSAVDNLARQPGQRDLIFTSDGFISGELVALKDGLTRRALREGVAISTLSARGLNSDGPGRPLNEDPATLPTETFNFEESTRFDQQQSEEDALRQLAQVTGGQFFHNNNDLALGFRRLGLAPAFKYELGFDSTGLAHDGKFHSLSIKLVPPVREAVIEARRGYFAPASKPSADDMEASMVQAMRGTAVAAGVPATLRTTAATGGLDVEVRVDVAKLPFLNRQGRREQQIVFIAGLFDPSHNRFVIAKRGVVDLALTEATEKRWAREGMGARITLSAPPGRYRLRVVVLEATDGKLSSFSRPAVVYEPNKHSKSGG